MTAEDRLRTTASLPLRVNPEYWIPRFTIKRNDRGKVNQKDGRAAQNFRRWIWGIPLDLPQKHGILACEVFVSGSDFLGANNYLQKRKG